MVRYFSDMTHKYYDTIEEAQKAEQELLESAQQKEKDKNLALENLRAGYEAIEHMRAEANKSIEIYSKTRNDFNKQLVEFHKKYGYIPNEYRNFNPLTMFFNW